MPFDVRWYVEGRIVAVHQWGELTLDDMRETTVTVLERIQDATPPTHLLIDMRDVTKMPSSLVQMLKEIEVLRQEPTIGWSLLITNSSLMHFFGVLASNLVKASHRSVHDYEEANEVLKRIDPTLVDLLPEKWEVGAPDSP